MNNPSIEVNRFNGENRLESRFDIRNKKNSTKFTDLYKAFKSNLEHSELKDPDAT